MRCDIAPRYSGGSSGYVDLSDAKRTIEHERRAYKATLEGIYGEEAKAKAERLGLAWIAWTTAQKGRNLIRVDQITGVTLIQPLEVYPRFVPVYANDLGGYNEIVQKLKRAKINTQEWQERTPSEEDGFTERRLICVAEANIEEAHLLIEWARLTPLPDLHNERKIA